jgi:AcrR family transcriptional regulator
VAVTQVTERSADRIARRQIDKFAGRREELASAAIQTLAQLGIAKTSLREIAQNSAFSHGVLHYYFSDKIELITYCVKQYMADTVARYDAVVATDGRPEDIKRRLASGMAASLRDEGLMHRLWYDLRNHSQFDDMFRADVVEIDKSKERMVWRIVTKFTQLAGLRPAMSSHATYAVFDGLFQNALFAYLAGDQWAPDALEQNAQRLLELVSQPSAG